MASTIEEPPVDGTIDGATRLRDFGGDYAACATKTQFSAPAPRVPLGRRPGRARIARCVAAPAFLPM